MIRYWMAGAICMFLTLQEEVWEELESGGDVDEEEEAVAGERVSSPLIKEYHLLCIVFFSCPLNFDSASLRPSNHITLLTRFRKDLLLLIKIGSNKFLNVLLRHYHP